MLLTGAYATNRSMYVYVRCCHSIKPRESFRQISHSPPSTCLICFPTTHTHTYKQHMHTRNHTHTLCLTWSFTKQHYAYMYVCSLMFICVCVIFLCFVFFLLLCLFNVVHIVLFGYMRKCVVYACTRWCCCNILMGQLPKYQKFMFICNYKSR